MDVKNDDIIHVKH